jgi:hypothetical protein
VHVLSPEQKLSLGGLVNQSQQIEQRRLPRSVGADQGIDPALANREMGNFEQKGFPNAFDYIVQTKYFVGHRFFPQSPQHTRKKVGK